MRQEKPILLGSLFDGIGAVPYAASFFGINTVWASEILPNAVSVTHRHFPNMEHMGDITKLNGGDLPPVDVVAFGSPCQSWSVAGDRSGFDGKSGLFMEAIRILREMRKATNGKYPQIALFENVVGLLNCRAGGRSNYQAVLEAFCETEIPMPESGRWANAGMVRGRGIDLAWVVKDSQYHRTAQRRRRLFVVVDFTGQRAGEILFVSKSLSGYFAARERERQGASGFVESGVGSESLGTAGFNGYRSVTGSIEYAEERAPCMNANMPSNVAAFMAGQAKNARTIAYSETLSPTLKGSPSGLNQMPCICEPAVYGICSDKSNSMLSKNPHSGIYKAETCRTLDQNCANPGCNQGGMVIVEPQIARTLTARHDSSPCVDRGQTVVAITDSNCLTPWDTQQARIYTENGVSPTLAGADGGGGRNPAGLVMCSDTKRIDAYGFDLQQITSKTNRSSLKEVQPSLCAAGSPHVVHPDVSGTLCASGAGLSRPAGNCNETDLCVVQVMPESTPTLTSGDHPTVATYCLQGNMIGRKDQNGPQGNGINEEVCFTISAADRHAVAAIDCRNLNEGEVSGTLQSKGTGGFSLNYQNPVRTGYIVRRLTPTEAERLMSFPDDWTKYGHDGKLMSDSARYQFCGNSIVVNVLAYIMQNIAEQLAAPGADV